MTMQEIHYTLDMLYKVISKIRLEGLCDKEIKINMGRQIYTEFSAYKKELYMFYTGEPKSPTIWGYPVNVVCENPMLLEVCVVESVPIYKESEG